MQTSLRSWLKANALTLFLAAIILALLAGRLNPGRFPLVLSEDTAVSESAGGGVLGLATTANIAFDRGIVPPEPAPFPPTDSDKRLVLTDTSLSLLVQDVPQSITAIRAKAEELGGFLVDAYLSAPEGADTGSITVRVPADKQEEALNALRGLAVRVTSETVTGTDVTDQYEDLEARLAVLEKTKAKFETILDEARTVQDSLQVQRELVSLQQQIDAVKGRQQYLERSAQLVRITAYLSTDELALPYAPDETWRPEAVFKQAVRSLVGVLRNAGSTVIWVVVFAPLWIPAVLILRALAKRLR